MYICLVLLDRSASRIPGAAALKRRDAGTLG
jgi:hypothetical protein